MGELTGEPGPARESVTIRRRSAFVYVILGEPTVGAHRGA